MPDDIDIPETTPFNGRTYVYDGLAQTDIDMDHHRLINLDDSNLPGGAPPSVTPPPDEFLHSWNAVTRVWGHYPVSFPLLTGVLTLAQARAIHVVGVITEGIWQGSPIGPNFAPRLDAINLPIASVDLNHHRITNLANPSDDQDAVNLRYLNSILPGLRVKEAVQCATTHNIGLAGLQRIDGHDLTEGQRVLVKNQTDTWRNGIWRAHAGVQWTRADDSDTEAEVSQAYCFVINGDVNGNTAWVQNATVTNLVPPGIGTGSPLHYVIFSVGGFGPPGPPGVGVPPGGATGNILSKIDGTNYNTHWIPFQPLALLPAGGEELQVLRKSGPGNYETEWGWGIPPGGDTGNALIRNEGGLYGSNWVDISNTLVPADGLAGDMLIRNNVPGGHYGKWFTAPDGLFVPDGTGKDRFFLMKNTNSQYGSVWLDIRPTLVPSGIDATPGQVLTFVGTIPPLEWDHRWMTPSPAGGVYNILQTVRLDPLGTTNTTGVMMGLGVGHTFTPFVTGKVIVTIAGFISNSQGGNAIAELRYGVAPIPNNNGSVAGTAAGGVAARSALGANMAVPFSITAALTGLTVGVPVWFDLYLKSSTSAPPGTASVFSVTVSAWEIP